MPCIVFLLKRDVNDRVRNRFADSVKELGFSDNHFEFGVEVHFVAGAVAAFFFAENAVFKHFKHLTAVIAFPFFVDSIFVLFCEGLRKLNVVLGGFSAGFVLGQDFSFGFELVNWGLDPCDDASSPCDFSGIRRHVFGSWRIGLVTLIHVLHLIKLLAVSIKHVFELILKSFLDFITCLNVLKMVKQLEGAN